MLYRNAVGGDLATSYFGCRIVAAHQTSHLFSRDAANYAGVNDPVWIGLAQQQGYAIRRLHPYVQIPLWAFSLEPLCTHTGFQGFKTLFLVLANLSLAAVLWLIARNWAHRLEHPAWLATICTVLLLSAPYDSAISLVQTHILIILLTLVALASAERHPVLAGLTLALAAVIKVTPAWFFLYWLLLRRWRATGSFAVCGSCLVLLNLALSGWPLTHEYLRSLGQISDMLLVSWDNQSLAAWWMQQHYPFSETQLWRPLPLPRTVKLTSLLLTLLTVSFGALLDRRASTVKALSPYGAAIAFLGLTSFAAIAWDHYFILLVFPLMLLLQAALERRSVLLFLVVVLVCALNVNLHLFVGLAHRLQGIGLVPPMRAQFVSALLCMPALAFAAVSQHRALSVQPLRGTAPELVTPDLAA